MGRQRTVMSSSMGRPSPLLELVEHAARTKAVAAPVINALFFIGLFFWLVFISDAQRSLVTSADNQAVSLRRDRRLGCHGAALGR